jgi:phage terminase small subunit
MPKEKINEKTDDKESGTGGLTPKQKAFCEQYLVDLNATQAAIRAAYSKKTARSISCELLTKPDISNYIGKLIEKRQKRTEVTADYVITNLRTVTDRCMQTEPVLDHGGKETGEYRFDSRGANRALELLGKHLGMFEKDNAQRPGLRIIIQDEDDGS